MGDVSDSTTYKEVIVSPQSNFWIDAIKDETTSMSQNKVWNLVDFLDGCCHTPIPIRPKWRIRTESEARDYLLGLSLTGSFSELNLYLWVYNQFL